MVSGALNMNTIIATTRKVMQVTGITVLLCLPVQFVQAEEALAGFWQHESDPIWLAMQPDEGVAIMVRNDNRPDRVGFQVVTDLVATDKPKQWSGQVFAAQLGEYRDATITLKNDDRMAFTVKVGFMRRTVEWQRVDAVPDGPTAE
jgi:uncharacterized protein (DUF2147 family)